jgi:GT2 family glycosyltransferase
VFVKFDPGVRVHLGVVALGEPPRLRDCLSALVDHESRHDFVVSCLVNRDAMRRLPLRVEVPDGVLVERPSANVGWSGGLHLLRTLSEAELFVWVQDDMLPEHGWLDALVDAADAHPSVGVFGALRVDDQGQVLEHSGGWARPPDIVAEWNDTDTTVQTTPTEVTLLDWVTSKGCLTRTRVFDEVGGPDPRLWPLNHVDKDYSTHVRCHGYDVALVPSARLRHAQNQSSPLSLRAFLDEWRDGWFDERWAGPATALTGRTSGLADHRCAEWRTEEIGLVEGLSGREASAMLVPFARAQFAKLAGALERHDVDNRSSREQHDAAVRSLREQHVVEIQHLEEQHEAGVRALAARTAELEKRLIETEALLVRVRSRVHRLRRRLRRAQPPPSLVARLSHRLRRLR